VLGRLHGYFSRRIDELNACDFLIKHTPDFFWTKAEDGLRGVAQIAPHLNERLQNLVRRYRPVVDALASQPTTLVHGGCRPTNILINVASDPSRVCVVDWEEAGVGGPCFDLAYLLDGVQPPTLDRLLDAYDRAARDYGLAFSRGEMKYLIDCCRLHMIMNYFSRAALRGYDEQAIAKLIGVGEQIGQLVFHRRG
jgi:aminoglycoside phosphotransferase (APT) family kinase protein